jgi:uncharacterized protein (TIGR03083 family)
MKPARWAEVRNATLHSGSRFHDLIRHAGARSTALATRSWTVADSAAHVLSIAGYYATLFDKQAPVLPVPNLLSVINGTNVDTVRRTNAVVLRHLGERDPVRLAAAIEDSLDRLLAATAGMDPRRTVPWLGNSRVPVAGVLSHLVNEFLVHGWDMARALHRPWPMPDAEAALFLEQFLFGMIRHDYGVLLNHGGHPPRRTIAVEFRSAYTESASLVVRDGRVHVGAPDEPVDAHVTFRPAGLNLMLFGRVSVVRAVARGDVRVGGPRPWLLPAFLRFVHMPRN